MFSGQHRDLSEERLASDALDESLQTSPEVSQGQQCVEFEYCSIHKNESHSCRENAQDENIENSDDREAFYISKIPTTARQWNL
jgi:hypothetical protein